MSWIFSRSFLIDAKAKVSLTAPLSCCVFFVSCGQKMFSCFSETGLVHEKEQVLYVIRSEDYNQPRVKFSVRNSEKRAEEALD